MSLTLEGVLANSSNNVATREEPKIECPTKRKSVCVVVPVWNKSDEAELLTFKALQSLHEKVDEKVVDMDVVVVDNDSRVHLDWKTTMFKDIGMELDVLNLKENRGFGPAVNLGTTLYPKSDFVCQMNSDCELVEDSVNILINAIVSNGLAASMPEHYENCKHYDLDKSAELMGPDWRFGAFWIMQRKWWDLVGGFDPAFEMCYWEDTDLWRRVEEEGGKIAGWRGTWIKHVGGASSLPNRDSYFDKNRRLFEDRWGKK